LTTMRTIKITGYYLKGPYPKLYGYEGKTLISLILREDEVVRAETLYPIGNTIKVAVERPDEWRVIDDAHDS